MNKPLPCPLCGSSAYDMGGEHCCCSNDDCPLGEMGNMMSIHRDAWNTRHTPEGWQLVPEWPTHKMSLSGKDACGEDSDYISAYEAMLAAAPKWGGE